MKQNLFLVFIPAKKNTSFFSSTTPIKLWKVNGMWEKNIEKLTKLDSTFAPTLVDHHLLPDITFDEHCLANNIYILQ